MHKGKILKIISTIFVLVWMITVFIFSSQDGTQTLNTSGAFIYAIESTVNGNDTPQVESYSSNKTDTVNTQDSNNEKYNYSQELQTFVRKNAHYFLYTIGGIILSVFFYAFFKENNKIYLFAILTGMLYAMSDEFHQRFVAGRTSRITDVGIDTLGVITGTILFMIFINILIKSRKKKSENGGIKNVTF